MTSWDELKNKFQIRGYDQGHRNVVISREGIQFFLRLLYHSFDEEYYLLHNEDVRLACQEGKVSSAFEHYIHFGFYEGRFPGFRDFDPVVYLELNKDLHFLKEYPDWEERARNHYKQDGFREGRQTRR
ncbi:hypothetical protein G6M04_28755 [Agrobacterium rhizogenes]|uniref:hypothetical protein n=1 Tax=Rhizobium rhizogenes TaxID=359 RepID=UPI0015744F17|nr:hypothetical protein [Rhizobium rhizogenes]NTG51397.1 hypothetical protein [Rhizobium rhizogenes]